VEGEQQKRRGQGEQDLLGAEEGGTEEPSARRKGGTRPVSGRPSTEAAQERQPRSEQERHSGNVGPYLERLVEEHHGQAEDRGGDPGRRIASQHPAEPEGERQRQRGEPAKQQ